MEKLKDLLYLFNKDKLYIRFKVKKEQHFIKETRQKYTHYEYEIIPYNLLYNIIKLKNGRSVYIDNIKDLRVEKVSCYYLEDSILLDIREYMQR